MPKALDAEEVMEDEIKGIHRIIVDVADYSMTKADMDFASKDIECRIEEMIKASFDVKSKYVQYNINNLSLVYVCPTCDTPYDTIEELNDHGESCTVHD